MANQEQLDILKQGGEVWNRWRESCPDTPVDLGEADIGRVDLSGADLSETNLSGANLSGGGRRRLEAV